MNLKLAGRVGLLVAVPALIAPAHAREPQTFTIAGTVTGGSGHHPLYVALWSEQGFLNTPAETSRLPPGTEGQYRFVVPSGRWGVSAFEDINENGRLDMGMFGPKEPNGFWREFKGHHKPRFEEIAVLIDHDVTDANIKLR